jgi:hypothetical protein
MNKSAKTQTLFSGGKKKCREDKDKINKLLPNTDKYCEEANKEIRC